MRSCLVAAEELHEHIGAVFAPYTPASPQYFLQDAFSLES